MIFTKRTDSKSSITLKDLVKPKLSSREKAAINRALKGAQKDQQRLRKKAANI